MNDRVAELRGVSLGYGTRLAVEDVSFTLRQGEYAFLIGRNGSGKSTLLKGMLGLLVPKTGCIHIEGGPDATAFLPQSQPGGADFPATVREVALSGCQRSRGLVQFYSRADRELAAATLELLGIADLRNRRIGSLSGGQRQRAFLARCLCRRPRLLLLDEPYTGLDPEAAEGLSRLLADLQDRQGITILMSSHDLGVVAACANRVLVLDRKLIYDGDAGEWLERFNQARHVLCDHLGSRS
ncbi:MAG: metal ABC transporter ATP-binding protein [Planctomycetes bacterium]|nr:metal ABC transporter ATP-binding protein [Planctomycetota bacterium]